MDLADATRLVDGRATVRVYSRAVGGMGLLAEGRVVACSRELQICVEAEDGNQSWWPITLPIETVDPPTGPWFSVPVVPWNYTDVDGEPVIVALTRVAAQQLAQAAATLAANYPDDEEDDE